MPTLLSTSGLKKLSTFKNRICEIQAAFDNEAKNGQKAHEYSRKTGVQYLNIALSLNTYNDKLDKTTVDELAYETEQSILQIDGGTGTGVPAIHDDLSLAFATALRDFISSINPKKDLGTAVTYLIKFATLHSSTSPQKILQAQANAIEANIRLYTATKNAANDDKALNDAAVSSGTYYHELINKLSNQEVIEDKALSTYPTTAKSLLKAASEFPYYRPRLKDPTKFIDAKEPSRLTSKDFYSAKGAVSLYSQLLDLESRLNLIALQRNLPLQSTVYDYCHAKVTKKTTDAHKAKVLGALNAFQAESKTYLSKWFTDPGKKKIVQALTTKIAEDMDRIVTKEKRANGHCIVALYALQATIDARIAHHDHVIAMNQNLKEKNLSPGKCATMLYTYEQLLMTIAFEQTLATDEVLLLNVAPEFKYGFEIGKMLEHESDKEKYPLGKLPKNVRETYPFFQKRDRGNLSAPAKDTAKETPKSEVAVHAPIARK